MFSIKPSEFKHTIEIGRFIDGKNEDNIPIQKWERLYNTRAKILNVRGEEFYNLGTSSKEVKSFYIRYNHNYELTTKDRIKYNSKFYNITYVNNVDEANRYIEIRAEVVE